MAFTSSALTIPWVKGLESGRMDFGSKGCWGRKKDAGNNESLAVLSSEELQNLAARVEGTIVTKISEGVSLSGAFEFRQVEVELVSS